MGQKVRPSALRLGIIRTWQSSWYADKKSYREFLQEDLRIRRFVREQLRNAGITDMRIERRVEQRRALRAERAAIGRVVGIALDVGDLGLLALGEVALGIEDDAAADRAIGAGVARLGEARELVGSDRCCVSCFGFRETERSERRDRDPRACASDKLATREFHVHCWPSLSY